MTLLHNIGICAVTFNFFSGWFYNPDEGKNLAVTSGNFCNLDGKQGISIS